MRSRLVPLITAFVTAASLAVVVPTAPAAGTPASPGSAAPRTTAWKPRPPQFPGTVTRTDLRIPMDDGVVLRGDLTLPADAAGNPVRRRFPVVITITAYNKGAMGRTGLAGPGEDYLVRRGYAQLTVDARGTGSSEGVWGAFSRREAKDAGQVVAWAHSRRRPWSNGKIGMTGPSYMGISQLFAASRRPAGLKAIFPQVPAADVYRDVVASGGQVDVGFIPLWLGLVTGSGLIPPAYAGTSPESGIGVLVDRLMTATTFTAPLLTDAVLGGKPAYDGRFYRDRSPIEVIDRVDVPTFLIAGQDDLFQRGTPMVFDALRRRGVPTKMIVGPWDHLQGSSGAEVGDAGHGELVELQLRWFDRYVRGRPDLTLDTDIPPLTYYEQGSDRWVSRGQWLARDLRPRTFALSGSATPSVTPGRLVRPIKVTAGESVVPAVPVSGVCTRSANQWTAGILQQMWPDSPCLRDQQHNDRTGVVFETAPVRRPLRIQGPINARLFTSTPSGDGMWSVTVSDVAPDGTVDRLTGGWQVISHRALVRAKSRYLDGRLVQPWHPFTKRARQPLPAGKVAPVDVEVFPTGAAIRRGHRLRVSIQAFDVPHLLPPLPDLPSTLAPLTIHTSRKHPSVVTLPTR